MCKSVEQFLVKMFLKLNKSLILSDLVQFNVQFILFNTQSFNEFRPFLKYIMIPSLDLYFTGSLHSSDQILCHQQYNPSIIVLSFGVIVVLSCNFV